MAVVAKPYSLYTSGPQAVGALPANARIDVGNSSLFVLTFRGASGTALVQSTLDSVGDTGWQPLVYSTTLDGATTSGAVDYVDGTRLFVRGPLSFIQVNGTVTSGALTLWYFGWPFGASSGGTHIDFTDLEVILNGILLALESQTTELSIGLQPVGPFNPLPVSLADGQTVRQQPGAGWPVQASSVIAPQVWLQTAAVAAIGGLLYDCSGMSGVTVQLTISATATVTWEVLRQDGTWDSVIGLNIATGATATTATASGGFWVPTAGFRQMRARISTYGSGLVWALAAGYYGTPPYMIALLAQLISGEDQTNNVLRVEGQFSYSAVAVADVQVKGSAGFLHTVTISCNDAAPTAGSLIIYDNTAESGTQVFNHTFTTTPFAPFTLVLDYIMGTGIYLGFTTTGDVNVSCSYR